MNIISRRKRLCYILLTCLVFSATLFMLDSRSEKGNLVAEIGSNNQRSNINKQADAENVTMRTSSARKLTKTRASERKIKVEKSYYEIAGELASEDFDKALLFFSDVPKDKRDEYISGLLFIGAKDHFYKLYEFIYNHKLDFENPDDLILSLLTFAARKSSEGVFDLLRAKDTSDNEEEFNLILKGYFGSGLHRDFDKLTDSINLLVDVNDRNRAFQETVKQVGPVELDEFMSSLSSSNDYSFVSSDSYYVLVERLLRSLDPKPAEAIARKIQDNEIKIKAIKLIENFKSANKIE